MKKLILILLIIVTYNMYSVTKVYTSITELEDSKVTKYLTVYIYCYQGGACHLVCHEPDPSGTECSWAGATWCDGCDANLFNDSFGQEMFDHAYDKINEDTLSGTYYSNIYIQSGQRYVYRTVTWSVNEITQLAEVTLTITE